MNKNRKTIIAICLSIAILSSTIMGISSEYSNDQTMDVQNSNAPSPIGTSNVPFRLNVSIVSPMIADGGYRYNPVWVQIQDLYGNPARAPRGGLLVSLSSSNSLVGTVPNNVFIPEGRSWAYTQFSSGWTAGTTVISASAPGLVSGSAIMKTITNTPTKFAVYITPPTVFADGGTYYWTVTVELQDASGNVAFAPSQGLAATLYSSNETVGRAVSSTWPWVGKCIWFSAGWQYYQAHFISTTTPGKTTIYVTAPGMTTGSATMTTIPVNTALPHHPKLYLGPPEVWAFGGTDYWAVFVQLLDSSGVPTKAPAGGIGITLTSRNTSVGTVPASMTIPEGSMYSRTTFRSTNMPGSTLINASFTMIPARKNSATMTVNGYVATKLKAYRMLSSEFADNSLNNFIYVELQDSNGNPARAPHNIIVGLLSSDVTFGATQYPTLTISEGNIFDGVWFDSTFTPGTTTIQTTAGGFINDTIPVKTVGPAQYKLGVYLAPSKVWTDSRTYWGAVLIVVQDASGNPVRAKGRIDVGLTLSDPTIGSVGTPVTIWDGWDGVSTWFRSTSTAGATTISAFASGIKSGSAVMTTVAIPATSPTKLVIEGRPKFISANGLYWNVISVSLWDASNNPARAPTSIGVITGSSDVTIGSCGWGWGTPGNLEIPANDFYVGGGGNLLEFQTTFTPGTAKITATARLTSTKTITGTKTFTTGEYTPISKSYQFDSIRYLFYKNTFLVVGDAAASKEAMAAAVFAPALTTAGTLPPTTRIDSLLKATEKSSGNLIAVGYNNTIRTSYPLGIVVSENSKWFNITATTEGKSINFTKSNYPSKSVAIVYLQKEGTRALMFMWGYGWRGTYAAALFMSDTANWQTYATKHLLFLQWTDTNANGFVEKTEITVATSA